MFVLDLAEPFDGTNTARAVHEKQKFDMIRGEFAQVKSTSCNFSGRFVFQDSYTILKIVAIKPVCF